MPKQRKRIVFCDCLDCVSRKNDPYPSDAALAASEAAARQQPPPKALLIVGSGLVQTRGGDMAGPMNTLDEIRLPHLDQLVREGHTGLLASRSQRPGEAVAWASW